MTLKRYRAPTMAEALAEVKRDLGRDAVILHTRNVRKGGLLGIGGRRLWEVTASPNVNVPERVAKGRYVPEAPAAAGEAGTAPGDRKPRAATATVPPPVPAAGSAAGQATDAPSGQREEGLAGQVRELRGLIESLLRHRPAERPPEPQVPPQLEALHARLIGQDIHRELVTALVEQLCLNLTGQQLADGDLVQRELRKVLAGRIRTADREADDATARPPGAEDRPARVIALIGPTGVGKTTTIAKLAANYKIREHRKVGLITIDTYRIAAVDQLRTYAEIIDVPLRAVLTAGELHQAIHGMRELDVVLIDTAGRSQNNRLRLNQLRTFLAAARADEVHLVVSATGNQQGTRQVLERFLPLGAERLIVTKLDEAAAFGVLVNVSALGAGPLSYVTTGQDVPEDIAPADAEGLAGCILAGGLGG